MLRAAERIYDLPSFTPRHWDLDESGQKKPNKWRAWSTFKDQGYINELDLAQFHRLVAQLRRAALQLGDQRIEMAAGADEDGDAAGRMRGAFAAQDVDDLARFIDTALLGVLAEQHRMCNYTPTRSPGPSLPQGLPLDAVKGEGS